MIIKIPPYFENILPAYSTAPGLKMHDSKPTIDNLIFHYGKKNSSADFWLHQMDN